MSVPPLFGFSQNLGAGILAKAKKLALKFNPPLKRGEIGTAFTSKQIWLRI